MAASKQVSPAVIAIVVVIVLLVLGGVWYKTMGPGSAPSATATQLDPSTPPQGPMGGPAGGGAMPPGGTPPGPGMPGPR